MWKKILIIFAFLASAKGQGYGNIEDDSSPTQQKPIIDSQQQISSLPQYDPDPSLENYGPSPNSNLQGNPSPQSAPSQNQNYWWKNQNAFQKPAGHPGVEQLGQSAPAPAQTQPQRPTPQQSNRNPNSYNPPQNSYNQPQAQPQKPASQAPYKPQNNNQFQQNSRPSANNGGWTAPSQHQQSGSFNAPAEPSNFNLPPPSNSLGQPNNNAFEPQVAPECMLLNKADCHKSGFNSPAPGPSGNNLQQNSPASDPYEQPGSGYNNVPKPPQGYTPPQSKPQQPQQPQQTFQPQEPQAQEPPAGYYQPPQSPQQPQPQKPNQYETSPQNFPNNQNYQPQPGSDSQPASSFPVQNQQSNKPYQQKPYSPPPQQQQQQYRPNPTPQKNNFIPAATSRPQVPSAPQRPNNFGAPAKPFQPQSQFQNNGQGIRPNNQRQQQQQPANYDDQLPYPGCPAAMLCVSDDRCNLIGIIEEAPITLSAAEKIHRVALSRCSEPSTGIEGVCCRDPNYKDPWPDMQGGSGGGDHQHHHGGNHHNKGQGQGQSGKPSPSNNNFQPQSQFQSNSQPTGQQQQPSNNFRNPYAGSRGIGGNKGCGASY